MKKINLWQQSQSPHTEFDIWAKHTEKTLATTIGAKPNRTSGRKSSLKKPKTSLILHSVNRWKSMRLGLEFDMNKLFQKIVKNCNGCPNSIHDDGDGETHWTSDHCKVVMEKRNDEGYLRDLSKIPDWCPLPDEIA